MKQKKPRHLLGIKWGRWKDRQCRKHGHLPMQRVSVAVGSAYWPICRRCGRESKP